MQTIFLLILIIFSTNIFAATPMSNFCATPPFITVQVQPNVLFIMDNSGSMNEFAYHEIKGYRCYSWLTAWTGYEPGKKYYGIFDSDKCYKYDNSKHYFFPVGNTVDDPSTPDVYERAACLADNCTVRCFSGNWLNWWTMRRIDIAKKVLTGGRKGNDNGEFVLIGSYIDRDVRRVFNDYSSSDNPSDGNIVPQNKNVYYTPFRRAIYSYFQSYNRYNQDVPAFSIITAKYDEESDFTGDSCVNAYIGFDNDGDSQLSDDSQYENIGETELDYTPYFVAVKIDKEPKGLIQKISSKMRIGYMHFNYDEGGKVENYIGDNVTKIIQNINETKGETWTPLSETLYEAMRYFKQETPYYYSSDFSVNNIWDPYYFNEIGQKVSCVNSFIVFVTDGEATKDQHVPDSINQNFPGDGGYGDGQYFDDIAYFMHTHDLRDDIDGGQTVTLYTVFAFEDSEKAKNMLKRAARAGGFSDIDNDNKPYCDYKCSTLWGDNFYPGSCKDGIETCASGCQEWDKNCDGVPDNFYYASNGEELEVKLSQIFKDIAQKPSSGTALGISFSTGKHERADGVVQALFYPKKTYEEGSYSYTISWLGELYRYSPKKVEKGWEKWKAGEKLSKVNYNQRKIYLNLNGNLVQINPSNTTQLNQIKNYACGTDAICEQNIKDIIEFILGKQINGKRNITINSLGETWKLGDIIYSSPKVVGYDNESYVFVGANDGMLHVFKYSNGEEKWSFIPFNVLPYLKYYYETNYDTCHLYYVDAEPYIYEVTTTTPHRKILIGGMNWGGATGCNSTENCVKPPSETCSNPLENNCTGLSAYFALDITDIDNPQLLWEFTDKNLGFTFSGPAIARRKDALNNWKYFVIFGSGPTSYNGYSTQNLRFFVLDLLTGNIMDTKEITGIVNGFAGRLYNEGIDVNGDNQTDYVLVGYTNKTGNSTSQGGVIKIYTGNDNPSNWEYNKNFFELAHNPVVGKVEAMKCFNNWYIFFGTGRFFYPGDNDQERNHLYGLPFPCDAYNNCNPATINSAHASGSIVACEDVGKDMANKSGWDKQLADDTDDFLKERCYTDPLVLKNKNAVYFFTAFPTNNICEFGGRTSIYAFNCATGEPLDNQTCPNYISILPKQSRLVVPTTSSKIYSVTPLLKPLNFTSAPAPSPTSSTVTPPVTLYGLPPYGGGGFFLPKVTGKIILWYER